MELDCLWGYLCVSLPWSGTLLSPYLSASLGLGKRAVSFSTVYLVTSPCSVSTRNLVRCYSFRKVDLARNKVCRNGNLLSHLLSPFCSHSLSLALSNLLSNHLALATGAHSLRKMVLPRNSTHCLPLVSYSLELDCHRGNMDRKIYHLYTIAFSLSLPSTLSYSMVLAKCSETNW